MITIFHNEERFLAEAVASVQAQAGPSWELLLVDDGSTDGSGSLARDLAHHDERLRYLRHRGGVNRGMSASRNLGIAEARGRWLTFLDADDMWLPGKLDAQLRVLADHPTLEVLVSPAQWWRSWDAGTGQPDWVQTLVDGEPSPQVVQPPQLLTRFLCDEWASICDLVIAGAAVERVGVYEPAFTGMFEDQVFHTKVFSRLPAIVTDRHWYRYRQHPAACTATAHQLGEHRRARRSFLDWLDRYLEAADRSSAADNRLRRLVRSQRRPLVHPHLWRAGRAARRVSSMLDPRRAWSPAR